MAAPAAPMNLENQINLSGTFTFTIPLQSLGQGPAFSAGGGFFNAGNPNATYTLTPNGSPVLELKTICDALDDLVQKGICTVS